jgi:hypothetical protein
MARMTPMQEDANDKKLFRDMGREDGPPFYGSYGPMLFTSNRAPANLEGTYKGHDLFIFSNGPSTLDLNMDLLKKPGVMTLSINNGAVTLLQNGITPDFWTCVDQPQRFVKQIWFNPKITKFIPFASFDKNLWDNEAWQPMSEKPKDLGNVYGFMRNEKFAAHRFFTESSMNWGCHKKYGGSRTVLLVAIRLGYLLGFKNVYLLGVDLNMSSDKKYSFEEGRTKGAINGNNSTYKRIITEYGPGIKKHADKLGYNIYNCNPTSALTCFPHVPFEEAIDRSLSRIGPTDSIKAAGMYLEEKVKKGLTREQALDKVGLTSSSK